MSQDATGTKEDVREAWWWEAEKKRTQRLDYLRKAVWSKGTMGGQHIQGIKLCLDKVYWWTKTFKETDSLPWVERRARAFTATMENMPVFIVDNSQIVGYAGSRPNELLMYTEIAYLFHEDLFYDTAGLIPEEEKWWVKECIDYWRPMCFQTQCEKYLSSEELSAMKMGPAMSGIALDGSSNSVWDFEFPIGAGLNNIIKLVEGKLEEAEDILCSGPANPDTLSLHEKIDEWRAMKLSAEAVITWANRYSRLAKIVAENFETDGTRKAELLKMSEMCAKIPANPAEHLHEAIQAERLLGIPPKFIERLNGAWPGRIDQLYWPYYQKDVLEEKSLTRQEAIELFAENNLRHYECTAVAPRAYRIAFQGAPVHLPTITIGGVDQYGRDACNELTEVVLEACQLARVGEPSYMFRYHPGSSVSALKAAYETIRQGLGYPSFQHDQLSMDTLMHNYGATLEEARSWCNCACMSPGVLKGRGGQGIRYACTAIMMAKVFELSLYDGLDPNVTRLQLGPHTGDPSASRSYDEFFEMFRRQVRWAYEIACRNRNKGRYMEAKYLAQPFGSCLFKRCVESGIDMVDARSEPLSNAWISVGLFTDVVDCLYGIKRLVFQDKKYTMAQLQEALKANWIGYAEMRQDFLDLPKFGNDVAEVDDVAAEYYRMVSEEVGRNVESGGGRFMTLAENVAAWSAFAGNVGALPNGRRQGDCLYDGGISPGAGFDKKGPTAVLRSVSKVDGRRFKQILLNQRLSPTQLHGEKGFQLWMNYMKTWYDLNIPHVQFNMVDNETLRAAQREPEKYQELIVRVAGYSAHFVELNALTQEGIIERTVQEI